MNDELADPKALQLAMSVFDGLSDNETQEIEGIALDRGSFFGPKSVDSAEIAVVDQASVGLQDQ